MSRLEQRGAVAFVVVIFIALVIAVWGLFVNGPMTHSDRVATLEEAKAQFQKSWDGLKAWAKLEETE